MVLEAASDVELHTTGDILDVHDSTSPAHHNPTLDLADYGRQLAGKVDRDVTPVDVLVGLSVGGQAAAVAAATTDLVKHLVLVSPTVDPAVRTMPGLLTAWGRSGRHEEPRLALKQGPEWWQAGPRRLVAGLRSALDVRLEAVLPAVSAELTVVHAEHDGLTSHAYAAQLAADCDGRLIVVPNASHSWPYRDPDRFLQLIESVLGG